MVGLGIHQRPNVKYFLRATVRVALASTEGDLGAMPAFHRLRSAQATEGEKAQLGETELTVLKIRLVQRLLHTLCREDPSHVRHVAQELFAQSELLLPCATEQGCKVVPAAKLFLLNSYDEMVIEEEQRQGYVAGVGLLDGVRATTLHNVGYLAYSQLLTALGAALGAPATFSHIHVMHALGCVQALHARLKERITPPIPVQPLEEEEEEEEQPEEGKESFEGLHAKALILYCCLNDMLGDTEPGPRYQVAAGCLLIKGPSLSPTIASCPTAMSSSTGGHQHTATGRERLSKGRRRRSASPRRQVGWAARRVIPETGSRFCGLTQFF
jgi:hypothetical protein